MPMLMIQTNVRLAEDAARPLMAEVSKMMADLLGKPEGYVMVALEDATPMLFAGTDDPCAYLELKSIGLPGDRTAELSAALAGLLEQRIGIRRDRLYIEFADAARHMWGFNGGTF